MSASEGGELDYSLSNYEGWRARVFQSTREKPLTLTMAQLQALSSQERLRYDDARSVWHANLGPFITPEMDAVSNDIDMIVQSNRQDGDKVRSSPVLDAHPGLGKSTLIVQYGAAFHRQQVGLYGATTPSGHDRIPVAMISLPPKTTVRSLNSMLCHFYAHPSADRGSSIELGKRASLCARETGTRLLIFDDAHSLNVNTTDGREVSNYFKWMATEFQATIIFVGVGLNERGLFTEGLGVHDVQYAQTARRWTSLTLLPFSIASRESRATWRDLLLAIEDSLVLANKHRGMIANDLGDYLYVRSTGHFQSLMALIMRGCHEAIRTGDEALSRELLDTVKNDAAAEKARLRLEPRLASGDLSAKLRRK